MGQDLIFAGEGGSGDLRHHETGIEAGARREKRRQTVATRRHVPAIEAMPAAQAIDFLAPPKTSRRLQAAHAAIRSVSPPIEHDRVLADDFAKISDLIASGKLAEPLR